MVLVWIIEARKDRIKGQQLEVSSGEEENDSLRRTRLKRPTFMLLRREERTGLLGESFQ